MARLNNHLRQLIWNGMGFVALVLGIVALTIIERVEPLPRLTPETLRQNWARWTGKRVSLRGRLVPGTLNKSQLQCGGAFQLIGQFEHRTQPHHASVQVLYQQCEVACFCDIGGLPLSLTGIPQDDGRFRAEGVAVTVDLPSCCIDNLGYR